MTERGERESGSGKGSGKVSGKGSGRGHRFGRLRGAGRRLSLMLGRIAGILILCMATQAFMQGAGLLSSSFLNTGEVLIVFTMGVIVWLMDEMMRRF